MFNLIFQSTDMLESSSSPTMYPDMWRPATPDRSEITSRSPLLLNTGSYNQQGGYDADNFPNILTFSPPYK